MKCTPFECSCACRCVQRPPWLDVASTAASIHAREDEHDCEVPIRWWQAGQRHEGHVGDARQADPESVYGFRHAWMARIQEFFLSQKIRLCG